MVCYCLREDCVWQVSPWKASTNQKQVRNATGHLYDQDCKFLICIYFICHFFHCISFWLFLYFLMFYFLDCIACHFVICNYQSDWQASARNPGTEGRALGGAARICQFHFAILSCTHADLKGLSKTPIKQACTDYIWLGHPNHNFATFPFLQNFGYLLAAAGNLFIFMILSLFLVLHFLDFNLHFI